MDTRVALTPCRLGAAFVPNYAYPSHIQSFERAAMRLLSDVNYNRLIIEVAVRHGKSFFFSQLFPAWYAITHPGRNIIICAHTAELAGEFVSWIRSFLTRVGPHFGRTVDPDQRSLSHVRILGGAPSELYAVGRGGAVAGRGAHLIVGDDLLRDTTEAASPTVRANINSWWHAEMLTRCMPGAKVVIAMSRRHPEDLSGFLLGQNAALDPKDQWNQIRFPAIAENGTALWPEQFPLDKLQRIQAEYEANGHGYIFQSLYQQDACADPSSIEFPRSYFEGIWDTPETPLAVQFTYGAVDPAQGKNESGDYSCAMVMKVSAAGVHYVDDILLTRCPITAFEEQCAEFFTRNSCDAVLVESNIESGFLEHMAAIAHDRYGTRIYGNTVHHIEQKEIRIRKYLTPLLHQHKIKFKDTPLMRLGVAQIMQLFGGEHDDAPDCLSMCVEIKKAHLGEPV